ncbi:hypothetical protein [Flavobacterium sp. W22_SRS_FP1]|uniref:hypothetical protein n=1 Tax=Flavobacterium sp. W22_SRS_FP1 TaxID=3240276 RepID=UPI003F8EFBDA
MKNIKFIIGLFVLSIFSGCSSENSLVDLDAISAPENITALATITQDNTGKVTFFPNGEGVTRFEINYGDGIAESGYVNPGESVSHVYKEGVYEVKITGVTLNGKKTEATKTVTVSFRAPEDLVVNVLKGSNLSVTVSAVATFETYFQVYFGDVNNEVPTDFMEGDVISHTYPTSGSYIVRIVALSGGKATAEKSETVQITNLTAAPTPTLAASNVISMFSDAYTNVTVNTWRTDWSSATLTDVDISGNLTKKYSALNFVGIEATSSPINASAMTHFHTDIWSSDLTQFKVKLVDFGANGIFGGGDDVEHEITVPSPAKEAWVSIDIPLSDFAGLTTRSHIAQLIFVGAPSGATTVYVDNVYFYKKTASIIASPTPTQPSSKVISMFSDTYTNVAVDTWRTSWSAATLEDLAISGNAVKKYSALNFVGIETIKNPINATGMTHFHTDVWSSDFTEFRVKLVDLGANGVFGGGDDVEHEVTIKSPAINTWVSLDIPLTDFTNLVTRGHIGQLIYVGGPSGNNTVYIDNVYFHN